MPPLRGSSALDRTFAAVVFDWDGTAVPDRSADADAVRRRIEALCVAGVDVAVVSGTHVGNVDGQLRARPVGPGRLHLCLNRGSEVFEVGPSGPEIGWRRVASPDEDAALDQAAEMMVAELADRGVEAAIVSSRLNRRKIDLIPEPAWADPPKARIDELVRAVGVRLGAAGLDLPEVVRLAEKVAAAAGVEEPRITSDAKHVEIGLTDKSDSMRWLLEDYWLRGIGPGLVLVGGDEFGPLGGVRGSDDYLLVPEASACTAVSVGVEPEGVPSRVIALGGGPARFLELLDDQLARHARKRVPDVDDQVGWAVEAPDARDQQQRVREAHFTLADGRVGVRGALEEDGRGSVPLVVAGGVYREDEEIGASLLPAPDCTTFPLCVQGDTGRRVLDLRTGVLRRSRDDLRTARFVSIARPGLVAMRVEGPSDVIERPDPYRSVATTSTMGAIAADGWTASHVVGGTRMVERVVAYAASDSPEPRAARAAALRCQAAELGFDALLREQRAAWAGRWDACDIDIPDDPELQLAVRFALFHLNASVADEGESPVGPRGLSGSAYGGHVFWDSEAYVLPVMAATRPRAARAILEYRVHRLAAAQRAAVEAGRSGARFPWESAADGTDVTPREGRTGRGTVVPILTGVQEEHIVADVAWAADHYVAWTGDQEFAQGAGRELLVETARYWWSRVEHGPDGRLHIRGVIGPDEYHETVDDNAYTNVMARWNLRAAADYVARYGGAPLAEADDWRAAAGLLVDGYSPDDGLYEQFTGYFDLEPLVAAEVAPPPASADLLLGHDRLIRSQLIKQPDVGMLHLLVPEETAPGSLVPNLEAYLPRTAHGSSLSPAVCAALLARAGRPDEALRWLRMAARIDLDDLTGTTAAGLHLAAMGGVWQAIVVGLAGIRPCGDALAVDPALPSTWSSLGVRLRWRGRKVRLSISPGAIGVACDGTVRIRLGDGDHVVRAPGAVIPVTSRRMPS